MLLLLVTGAAATPGPCGDDISKAGDHWVAGAECRLRQPGVRRPHRLGPAGPERLHGLERHRRHILYRKANLFGVGTWIKDGVIWVTVNFEQTTPGWG